MTASSVRRPLGRAPPLPPFAHRRDAEPENAREACLHKAEAPADRLNLDALDLTARPGDGLAEALEQRLELATVTRFRRMVENESANW